MQNLICLVFQLKTKDKSKRNGAMSTIYRARKGRRCSHYIINRYDFFMFTKGLINVFTGSSNKQPKIAAACVETLKSCLEAFGHKIVTLKSAFSTLPKLFHHRDKLVRGAVRDFFVEAHAWIGPIVKQQLEKEAKIEHW